MGRRELITLISGAVAAWPLAARERALMRRIGMLLPASEDDSEYQVFLVAFREELRKLGWIEGTNISMDIRWASAGAASMQRLARELVALQPDLILTQGTPATASVLQETRSIPIIFATAVDPVGSGFVGSFARPGGNVTGFTVIEPTMVSKWIELLKEVAPRVSRVAFLFNPATAPFAEFYLKPFRASAVTFAVEAVAAPVRDMRELDSAVRALTREPNAGLLVMPDHFLNVHRAEIISIAARYRLPVVYPYRFYPELGGLLSYGNDYVDNWQRAASYLDKILNGAKPSELPVQAPVKFELVINMKTAKALGLEVPWQVQQRADKVIE